MQLRLSTLALLLAAAACSAPEPAPKAKAAAPQVRIVQVGSSASNATVEAVGTVAVRRETALGFTSAGRIVRLTVNEGDVVRTGQMLAALDGTTVAADVAMVRAERDRAALEYRRSSQLLEQGWVTRPRVETAKAALDAANAQMRAAGFQSANASIVAPGPGMILARLAEPGQVVAAGTPVLVLGETASGLVMRLPLADRDAGRVRIGAPVSVRLAALDDAVLTGTVVELAGRADRATGTFAAEVALPVDARLRSGQIGTASILASGAGADSLQVPAAAIFAPRAGAAFVYVVDPRSGKTALRKVTIAETGDSGIRVTGGLARGEWVAVSRIDRLKAGMTVRPVGLPQAPPK